MCDSVWGYYYHGTVIWPCWHGRNLSGSQSQLAPALMGLACVCMCVCECGRMKVLCACMRVCAKHCSPSTMSRVLKHGAAWWQADRQETMRCNLWGALPREEWWVIKRKTLRDTVGARLQATGHWLCVLTSQQTHLWFSNNTLVSGSVSHTHTGLLTLLPQLQTT